MTYAASRLCYVLLLRTHLVRRERLDPTRIARKTANYATATAVSIVIEKRSVHLLRNHGLVELAFSTPITHHQKIQRIRLPPDNSFQSRCLRIVLTKNIQ